MGVEPIVETLKQPYLRAFWESIAVFIAIFEEIDKSSCMICDIPF